MYIASFQLAKEQIWDMPEASIIIGPNWRPALKNGWIFNCQQSHQHYNYTKQQWNWTHITHYVRRTMSWFANNFRSLHSYDIFEYILSFPLGDDGWHQPQMMNKKLMVMCFCTYWMRIITSKKRMFCPAICGWRAAKFEGEKLSYTIPIHLWSFCFSL